MAAAQLERSAPRPLHSSHRTGREVVVTGVGPVSAIGVGADDFWDALVAGRPGFGPIGGFDASSGRSRIAAEVPGFRLRDWMPLAGRLHCSAPRTVQLALAAAALAIDDADLGGSVDPDEIGVVVGTSLGNVGEAVEAVADCARDPSALRPHRAFSLFHHSAACLITAAFDLRGPVVTVSTGCNSGIDAVGHGLRLIQTGQADAVVAVGADAEVVPEVLAMLEAAGALATRYNHRPEAASRPFDADRDGNVIGEGAAALVLEAEDRAERRGARIYARVAGHACRAAGRRRYRAREPEPDIAPAVRSLEGALAEAGWAAAEVDAVNANGSSSVAYDILEARALAELFGGAFPRVPVHSIKSMLGQHGAGSSALQAVTACLSIVRGTVPPTINHETPDPACGPIRVVTEATEQPVGRVLVHAIGFGGFYYSTGAFAACR